MFRQVFLCVEETFPPPSKRRRQDRSGASAPRRAAPSALRRGYSGNTAIPLCADVVPKPIGLSSQRCLIALTGCPVRMRLSRGGMQFRRTFQLEVGPATVVTIRLIA